VSFGHVTSRQARDRAGRRQHRDGLLPLARAGWAPDDVKVIVRSGFDEMKASPWEKEDAEHEGIPILNCHVPKAFMHEDGKLVGMRFEIVEAVYDDKGRRSLVPTGEPDAVFDCDEVLIAVGQENAFPWIERDAGIDFDNGACRCWTPSTFQSTLPKVFFGGDAAFGPKNIITAVAHGHEAAVSIDRFLHGEDVRAAPAAARQPGVAEDGHPRVELRQRAQQRPALQGALGRGREGAGQHQGRGRARLRPATALKEAQRCLNCDVQTVFADKLCIECDACVDICPMDCISFTDNGDEAELRTRLKAPAHQHWRRTCTSAVR
jgi:formate dehydrogenase beta subunit